MSIKRKWWEKEQGHLAWIISLRTEIGKVVKLKQVWREGMGVMKKYLKNYNNSSNWSGGESASTALGTELHNLPLPQ